MPKLPRSKPNVSSLSKIGSKPYANLKEQSEISIKAAQVQASITVAAAADLPLPESYFYPIFFGKRSFDESYRELQIKPAYIGNERYVRPSDLRKIVEHRVRNQSPSNGAENLRKHATTSP
jgi:hypothetical protein